MAVIAHKYRGSTPSKTLIDICFFLVERVMVVASASHSSIFMLKLLTKLDFFRHRSHIAREYASPHMPWP